MLDRVAGPCCGCDPRPWLRAGMRIELRLTAGSTSCTTGHGARLRVASHRDQRMALSFLSSSSALLGHPAQISPVSTGATNTRGGPRDNKARDDVAGRAHRVHPHHHPPALSLLPSNGGERELTCHTRRAHFQRAWIGPLPSHRDLRAVGSLNFGEGVHEPARGPSSPTKSFIPTRLQRIDAAAHHRGSAAQGRVPPHQSWEDCET